MMDAMDAILSRRSIRAYTSQPVPDNVVQELLEAGCQLIRWEGKGGCCYMQDPFGFMFNLFEEPGAF